MRLEVHLEVVRRRLDGIGSSALEASAAEGVWIRWDAAKKFCRRTTCDRLAKGIASQYA
jgi:hypothetical protein